MENNIYNSEASEKKERIHHKIKRQIKKPKVTVPVAILIVAGALYTGYHYSQKDVQANEVEEITSKHVKTMILDSEKQNKDFIETVGSVKPQTKVDVVSLTPGTVRGLYFEVGDKVSANNVLASVHSDSVLTNYSNSQIGLTNAENNLEAIKRLTEENIKQAELGVQNAEEAVKAAEVGLEAAKDNYENTLTLQDKSVLDAKDSAIISFYDYLNFIKTTLDQTDQIIGANEGVQIAGISRTLGAQDAETVNVARINFLNTEESYDSLSKISPSRNTIEKDIKKVIDTLSMLKILVDNTVEVLDNTVANSEFTDASLSLYKNNFIAIRSNSVARLNAAKTLSNSLENIDLKNKQQLDQLENAIKSAESQLQMAEVSYKNALAAVETAKRNKEQQILGAKSSVDSVRGQLNLTGTQVSDLSIKAPISGLITGKYVELGAEVSAGTKIAEISQTDTLKIEASLTSNDVYRIKIGQEVIIGEDMKGTISSINPAADPVTKKVGIKISFDNQDKKLISGTFVDISIPLEKIEKTTESSVFIPLKAVNISQGDNYVFINVDGVAKKVTVETGKNEGALIEILSGLKTGDELIVEGSKNLEDGDKIVINN